MCWSPLSGAFTLSPENQPRTVCCAVNPPPIPELPPLVVVALGRGSRAPAPSGDGRVAVGARAVRARPVGMYAIPASHCLTVLFMPVGFAPATASAAARGQLVDRLGHVVDSQKISV